VDPCALALREAADNLSMSLGNLDDLGPELADTVANVYYRYALATGTANELTLAFALGTFVDGADLRAEIGVIMAQQEYVDDMVSAVRRAQHDPELHERMTLLTLDTLKFRIANAATKSAVRRSLERRLARTREIAGLYERMQALPPLQRQGRSPEGEPAGCGVVAGGLETHVESQPDHVLAGLGVLPD
jgi:hypothetical protein